MKSIFVGRHLGAQQWMKQQNIHIDEFVDNLQISQIERGDAVYGILPLNIIAEVNRCGASFTHINLVVPPQYRGQELTVEQMNEFGAHLQSVTVQLRNIANPQQADRRPKCLVMLASGEQLQNYLPALYIKPTMSIILATQTMIVNANRLADALRHALPYCRVDVIGEMPETRMEAMVACDDALLKIDAALHPVLNITGATKALSGALEETGRNRGADIFYWHGQAKYHDEKYNNAIEWIVPHHDGLMPSGLRPDIKAIALLNGYRVIHMDSWINKNVGGDVIQLAEFLLDPVHRDLRKKINEVFFAINDKQAKQNNYPANVLKDPLFKDLTSLLFKLKRLIQRDAQWFFNCEHDFELIAKSQWLEVYLLVHLKKYKTEFDLKEISHSLRIQPSSSKDTFNDDGEIDVAMMQKDVFWAFECKNVNYQVRGAKLDQAMRQIDSYAKMVGGKFARKVLFSVDTIPKTKLANLQRLGIDLIQGEDILPNHIQASLAKLLTIGTEPVPLQYSRIAVTV